MTSNFNKYKFEKYKTNLNNVKDTLNKYGVAIIPKILNQTEINNFRDGCWKYLEHIFKHPSIRDRHEILWYDFFNTKAKGNRFRKYIIEYLDILKDNNIYVNVITQFKSFQFINEKLDLVLKLVYP